MDSPCCLDDMSSPSPLCGGVKQAEARWWAEFALGFGRAQATMRVKMMPSSSLRRFGRCSSRS